MIVSAWRRVPLAVLGVRGGMRWRGGWRRVGGGGGGGGGGGTGGYTAGRVPALVEISPCRASPGADPSPARYPDVTGTVTDQNNWLRSWTNELYLWYSEVPDLNPSPVPDGGLLRSPEDLRGDDLAARPRTNSTSPIHDRRVEALSQGGVRR